MPRPAQNLTLKYLKSLRSRAEADYGFTAYSADAGQPGLYAWARRGKVGFFFAYRSPAGGIRRRLKIDDFGAITLERARAIALEWRGLLASGKDPKLEREEEALRSLTLGQAVDLYLDDLRQRAESGAKRGKRSGYVTAKRRLEKHVIPALGAVRLENLSVDQVARLHRRLKDRPGEANRTLTALSAVFGYAARRGKVDPQFNPCRHVERFKESGERRALTADETSALGEAMREAEGAGGINSSALLAIRLIALTGLRRSEVLGHESRMRRGESEGLRWGDVDLERGLIRLRDSKTGVQTRVIGEAAIRLLASARTEGAREGDPVCPGALPGQPFIGIDRPRLKLYKAAGIVGADLHSLRHLFASVGAHVKNGRYAAFVSPLLGHGYQKRSITERYIHSNPEALRPAADAISGAIAALLGLREPARVVAFRQ